MQAEEASTEGTVRGVLASVLAKLDAQTAAQVDSPSALVIVLAPAIDEGKAATGALFF